MKLDKSQCIALLLTGALLVNAVIHFTHPSYRYYKTNISRLDSEFKAFRDRVQDEFVPAVMFVATNISATAVFPSFPVSATNELALAYQPTLSPQPQDVDCHYFVSQGRRGFQYHGFPFFAGDTFFGEEILAVDPSCFKTTERLYYIRPNHTTTNKKATTL